MKFLIILSSLFPIIAFGGSEAIFVDESVFSDKTQKTIISKCLNQSINDRGQCHFLGPERMKSACNLGATTACKIYKKRFECARKKRSDCISLARHFRLSAEDSFREFEYSDKEKEELLKTGEAFADRYCPLKLSQSWVACLEGGLIKKELNDMMGAKRALKRSCELGLKIEDSRIPKSITLTGCVELMELEDPERFRYKCERSERNRKARETESSSSSTSTQ